MQTHQLKRNTKRVKSVQVGRGGKRGKTAGRGHKGQKQHGGHGIRPEMRDTIKKIPKLRGRGVNLNKSRHTPNQAVNIDFLDKLYKDGETVSPKTLYMKGVVVKVGGKLPPVKILSVGDTKKKLIITGCKISKTAKEKLEKAGSTVK